MASEDAGRQNENQDIEEKQRGNEINGRIPKRINVPEDGNCLYWAVSLAYFLPVRDKTEDIKNRIQKIFGVCDQVTVDSVIESLLQYHPSDEINNSPRYECFKEKVTVVFRQKIVDYMCSNSEEFKELFEEEGVFRVYLDRMSNQGTDL